MHEFQLGTSSSRETEWKVGYYLTEEAAQMATLAMGSRKKPLESRVFSSLGFDNIVLEK